MAQTNEVPVQTGEPPIQLTAKAVEMAKKKLAEGGEGVLGLRVGVRGGGCSGYSYVFDFATKVRPKRDLVYDFDGLKVVVDDRSVQYLQGSTLDWEHKLMGYGFKWRNPNASGGCGCGESFSV
ncbi:MAG: HesB/IscA family protein [Myxococcota bacterium]